MVKLQSCYPNMRSLEAVHNVTDVRSPQLTCFQEPDISKQKGQLFTAFFGSVSMFQTESCICLSICGDLFFSEAFAKYMKTQLPVQFISCLRED